MSQENAKLVRKAMSPAEQLTDPRQESEFAALVERHRRELQVHCYRMLGSFEDSEDLVQETFLRAWRKRASFSSGGPSSFRAWLYRIATNACLDVLRSRPRRVLPPQVAPAGDPAAPPSPPADLPWLQPYPDRLLEPIAPAEDEPGAVVVARETIELAFLAAIQHLPPRQRAVLILRDVLGWSAKDTASLLDASVASVNSALQRARATLRDRLGERRTEWAPVLGAERGGARAAAALRRRPRAGRRRRAGRAAARGRAPDDASAPHLVRGAGGDPDRHAAGLRSRVRPPAKPSSPARTRSRRPPITCDSRASRSTGRWRSTCFGSRADASRRSPRSSSPELFPAFGLRRRGSDRASDQFLADLRL